MRKKILIIVFLMLVIALFLVRLYVDANVIQLTKYDVESDKIPAEFDDYKIVQLSDLHSKELGKNSSTLIRKIDAEKPDIIVLTGDMITGNDADFSVFYSLVEELASRYKLYFITGNHEQALSSDRRDEVTEFLMENHVTVLSNKNEVITRGASSINLYGLWYSQRYYSENSDYILNVDFMMNALGQPNSNMFNILLVHNPRYFSVYADWGADLTLAGHVHGGMVRVPFVGAIFSPDEGLFPKYDAGLYADESGNKLIVSRGLGRGATGFRLFNRPDLVSITLKSKENGVD